MMGTVPHDLESRPGDSRIGRLLVTLRLFERPPRHPVVTVASVMKFVETTKPTAGRAIELLVAAGVLVEMNGPSIGHASTSR